VASTYATRPRQHDPSPRPHAAPTADAIRHGELSAKELLEATLERIDERDASINSTPVVFNELSQVQISQAPAGPLFGVPITVKDMYALPCAPRETAPRTT